MRNYLRQPESRDHGSRLLGLSHVKLPKICRHSVLIIKDLYLQIDAKKNYRLRFHERAEYLADNSELPPLGQWDFAWG